MFFVKIGVSEEINYRYDEQISMFNYADCYKDFLINHPGMDYWGYTQAFRTFNYYDIFKISFIELAEDYSFSILLWSYVFDNLDPSKFKTGFKGYWGDNSSGHVRPESYNEWVVNNKAIIPTTMHQCSFAKDTFINDKEIVKLGEKYLPVLDCETVISEDWLKLIPLKEKLMAEDYLTILTGISNEIEKENSVTEISKERIASIYEKLNSKLTNKSQVIISEWSKINKLLSRKNKMTSPNNLFWLKVQADTIMIDDLEVIYLPSDLLNQMDTEKLLNSFGVNIISDFKLLTDQPTSNDSLQNELLAISPYLSAIIEKKSGADFEISFAKLKSEIQKLKVVNSISLQLAYIHNEQQHVISKPDSYFDEITHTLFFIGHWKSPTTMYSLVEHIAKAMHIEKYQDELRLFLQLEPSEITEWLMSKFEIVKSDVEIKPTVAKFIAEIIPATEEEIKVSDAGILTDNSSIKTRISINEEAQEIVFSTLERNKFIVDKRQKITFTILEGVVSPRGKPIKVVVKSAKARRIYFTPLEWLALTEEDSQLFVLTAGNRVRNVTLSDLQKINDEFHMRFNTGMFVLSNLKVLANFFKGLPYTHFIFNAPESTTDYLQEFGLNQRNPTASDLSADDKNLLH